MAGMIVETVVMRPATSIQQPARALRKERTLLDVEVISERGRIQLRLKNIAFSKIEG